MKSKRTTEGEVNICRSNLVKGYNHRQKVSISSLRSLSSACWALSPYFTVSVRLCSHGVSPGKATMTKVVRPVVSTSLLHSVCLPIFAVPATSYMSTSRVGYQSRRKHRPTCQSLTRYQLTSLSLIVVLEYEISTANILPSKRL